MNTVPFETNHPTKPSISLKEVFLQDKVNIKPMNMVINHRRKVTVSLASLNEVRSRSETDRGFPTMGN